jgi:hypothetical protein
LRVRLLYSKEDCIVVKMGAGASSHEAEALSMAGASVNGLDLSCADVNTPRGETAKAEVKKLRLQMVERHHAIAAALASARFNELDTDKSGFLENDEVCILLLFSLLFFIL